MRNLAGALAPLLLALAGCLSGPIPQELVDVHPPPPPEPLRTSEIVRLSRVGLSQEVIVEFMKSRGVQERPSLSGLAALRDAGIQESVLLVWLALPALTPARKPAPRIVYRELFIPLWPAYSRGRWHLGVTIGCYHRSDEPGAPELPPPEPKPEPALPAPRTIDP